MAATGGSSEPSKLPGRGRDRELVLDRLEYSVTLWIFYRLEYHIYIYIIIIIIIINIFLLLLLSLFYYYHCYLILFIIFHMMKYIIPYYIYILLLFQILYIYTLWLFNSLPWYRWPIEIVGLPNLKTGGFSMANC